MTTEYLTKSELAERLRLSERTISRRVQTGHIPAPVPFTRRPLLWLRQTIEDWERRGNPRVAPLPG